MNSVQFKLISAKDRSEKPFAVAYFRLIQDDQTIMKDGLHDLLVYKVVFFLWRIVCFFPFLII